MEQFRHKKRKMDKCNNSSKIFSFATSAGVRPLPRRVPILLRLHLYFQSSVHDTKIIRAHRSKCPERNTVPLAAALAVNSCNNKIIYLDILTAVVDATYDLSEAACI